jgi:hypothetical protein
MKTEMIIWKFSKLKIKNIYYWAHYLKTKWTLANINLNEKRWKERKKNTLNHAMKKLNGDEQKLRSQWKRQKIDWFADARRCHLQNEKKKKNCARPDQYEWADLPMYVWTCLQFAKKSRSCEFECSERSRHTFSSFIGYVICDVTVFFSPLTLIQVG